MKGIRRWRRGEVAREGRDTLKELVYASGDDHSPLITWTIVQGQRQVGKCCVEVKEERSAVLLRASLLAGRAVKGANLRSRDIVVHVIKKMHENRSRYESCNVVIYLINKPIRS